MKIAILGEKFSLVREALPSLADAYPDAEFVAATFQSYAVLSPHFRFPRGLSLRDYPHARAPDYKPLNLFGWNPDVRWFRPVDIDGDWTIISFVSDTDGGKPEREAAAEFASSDRIVVLADAGPGSALAAIRVLDALLPEGHADPRVRAPIVTDLSKPRIDEALASARPIREAHAAFLRIDVARRRFDYCYAMNANVILKPIQVEAGMAADAPPLSKHALQTLYMLRGREPMSEGRIVGAMQDHGGTGRYEALSHVHGLGSPASRATILESLTDQGLLHLAGAKPRSAGGTLSLKGVSPLGISLLDALHPDCEDPDLPFRIRAWADLPEAEAIERVDRYIRTFFGKMQRYADRRFRAVPVT